MTLDLDNPYHSPELAQEGPGNTNDAWRRMRGAILLTLLCAGVGVLAPYVPNFWVGFRFAWVATCYLVGMGALSSGSRVVGARMGLGLIAGAALSYFFIVMLEYDYDLDQMRLREWTHLILPYVSPFGAIPSLSPAYLVLKIEKKQAVRDAPDRVARILTGARIGLLQTGTIALILSPFLYLGTKSDISFRPSSIPSEMLQGPNFHRHFIFFLSLIMTLVISGTLCGAIAGLQFDIPSKDETP